MLMTVKTKSHKQIEKRAKEKLKRKSNSKTSFEPLS